jgi:5-methylthioadenosine/S-adenosylhomocysteine deaminase
MRLDAEGQPRNVSLLVSGGAVVTMNPQRQVFVDGAVAVDGDAIVAVGDRREIEAAITADQVVDAGGSAVIPGLVNAHTHGFQSLYRGLGDDLPVFEWLRRMIYPLSSHLRAPDAFIGTQLACLEMIKGGVTTFADSFYVIQDPESVYQVAEAVGQSGIRGVIGRASSDRGDRPAEFKEPTTKAVEETERFIKAWHGGANGRVRVCAEALYTVFATPDLVAGLREVAGRYRTGFHLHAGEAAEEASQIRRETGSTIISYLDSINGLGPDVLLFHAVWVTDGDIAILADRGTSVAHCPVSNQYLAAGVAPVPRMLERGVNVALGSDGAASNNTQDLFETMKAAVLLQKVFHLDPQALTSEVALELATRNGAAALRLGAETGSLEVGKKADLAVVNLATPHSTPALKPVSSLVYCCRSADVTTVVVDGRVVMKDRQVLTMDEEEVIANAQEAAARLLRQADAAGLLATGRFAYLR